MENNYFDDFIKKELEDIEVKYNPEDWDLMEERLEQEEKLRERIILIKGIEIALMLLLVFTITQFLPIGKSNIPAPPFKPNLNVISPQSLPSPMIEQSKSIDKIERQPTKVPLEKQPKTTERPKTIIFAKAENTINSSTEQNTISTLPVQTKAISTYSTVASIPIQATTPILKKEREENRTVPIVEKVEKIEKSTLSELDFDSPKVIMEDKMIMETEEIASVNDFGGFEVVDNTKRDIKVILPKTKKLRFGMYFRPDANIIMAPYKDEEIQSYKLLTDGYTGGVSFGVQKDRWEIETGLAYSFLSYKPKPISEVTSSAVDIKLQYIDNIEYNMLSLPVAFAYNFATVDDWKFYAKGGGAMNLVASAKVDKILHIVGESRLVDNVSPSYEVGLFTSDTQQNLLSRFKDNHYISANIGFGVEKVLNNRFGLFIEPTYSHTFFGAGLAPNHDRINRVSLNVGAKVTL